MVSTVVCVRHGLPAQLPTCLARSYTAVVASAAVWCLTDRTYLVSLGSMSAHHTHRGQRKMTGRYIKKQAGSSSMKP